MTNQFKIFVKFAALATSIIIVNMVTDEFGANTEYIILPSLFVFIFALFWFFISSKQTTVQPESAIVPQNMSVGKAISISSLNILATSVALLFLGAFLVNFTLKILTLITPRGIDEYLIGANLIVALIGVIFTVSLLINLIKNFVVAIKTRIDNNEFKKTQLKIFKSVVVIGLLISLLVSVFWYTMYLWWNQTPFF